MRSESLGVKLGNLVFQIISLGAKRFNLFFDCILLRKKFICFLVIKTYSYFSLLDHKVFHLELVLLFLDFVSNHFNLCENIINCILNQNFLEILRDGSHLDCLMKLLRRLKVGSRLIEAFLWYQIRECYVIFFSIFIKKDRVVRRDQFIYI